ncbi:MAG: aminodeoxychorismate/anthranilate synthase component II [Candidatus Latescibacterota bacterium]
MILLIDNYDSFTYNLVQYMGELGAELEVFRNNRISLEEIERKRPEKIVISPGPCTPNEAGISVELIRRFSGKIPILGVCLGHQSIGQAFGGKIVRAPRLLHGKVSQIYHDGRTVFSGIPEPFTATRYHSLVVEKESLPDCFEISAWTEDDDNLIMGLRHRSHPTEGVQFHPESILTVEGKNILRNFLEKV